MKKKNLKDEKGVIETSETDKLITTIQQMEMANPDKTDEELLDEIPDELFNMSDETINESLEALDGKKSKKNGKKTVAQETEEIVNAFIADRTDKNWEKLQERFWWGIKSYAYKFVKNWDIASDITIEVFIKAYKKIDSYDPAKAKFSTWLWRICCNDSLQYLKTESRIQRVDSDISDIYDSTMLSSSGAGITSGEQYLVRTEGGQFESMTNPDIVKTLADASIAAIETMGGTAGTILKMKLVDNLKIREIAKTLNMNESTVKNYLYKGKEDVAKIIKKKHKDLYEMYLDSSNEHDNLEMIQDLLAYEIF